MSEFETSRRNLLYGLAAAGAAVPVVAACGSGEDDGTATADPTTTASAGGGATETPAGIPTSDIPVGGGAIYPDEAIVVTQPTAGTFKAFSSRCTHAGCPVNSIADGIIQCPCHGSRFSIADGAPLEGSRATSPLAEKTVTVSGSSLSVS